MKLEGIVTFVTVAEAGSLSEAARRLNLAKSVVSDRLAELEKTLATSLVHRTTRKLTLTEDGAAFLQRATRIARDVEDAAADMAERRGRLAGPLRLSAPVVFGRLHLGPAIYPFLAANPDVELALDLDDRRVDAAADGFDAVIRHGTIEDSRLVAWKLAPSRRILVAAPAYLEAHGAPKGIEDLERHRGIFYTNRGAADWRFTRGKRAVTVRGRIGLRVNNGDMMRDAAIAGLGIAMLPSFIANSAVKSGVLRALDIGAAAEPEFVYVAHAEARRPSTKLRALADHLRQTFGDPPYWDR
jgi:DNA-binding transcriptional LysR family regulator